MKYKLGFAILLSFIFLTIDYAEAQNRRGRSKVYGAMNSRRPDQNDKFLQTQWWLGFRAGANLTSMEVTESFTTFSPLNYALEPKEYESYANLGGQAGIEITFYHRGFSFSLQPNYRRQIFEYSNFFQWQDAEVATNTLELRYDQQHRLDYLEIPFFLKYDITRGNFRPFIQVGAYYAMLSGAEKSVQISGTDFASGNAGLFENPEQSFGADDLFISSSAGLAGGIGFSYDLWNVRIVFDVTYRQGLHSITDVRNRFSENPMSSIGDAMDDLQFQNISSNIGILFPLRFISKGFEAVN